MFTRPDRKVWIEVKPWARDFAEFKNGRVRRINEVFKVTLNLVSASRMCSDFKQRDLRKLSPGFVPVRVIAGE